MTPEDVNKHEAGHAAAALLLKIPIVGFGRSRDGGGYTRRVDFLPDDFDEDRARDLLVMLMSGPIAEDRELPDWPPSPDAYQPDERHMALFADYLGLTKAGWLGLCGEAYAFTASDEFDLLWRALTGLAEYTPTIDEKGLALAQQIVEQVRGQAE